MEASGTILEFIRPGCAAFDSLQQAHPSKHLKFSASSSMGNPRRMTARLRRHLDTMSTVVGNVFGSDAYMEVLQAYVEPPTDISKATLHNVGRAALLTIRNVSSEFSLDSLGVLAAVAREAGMDFVSYQNREYIYVSVIADTCQHDLDLVFLLDSSGSIESPFMGGAPGIFRERILEFVMRVTSFFEIGANRTRVGVATFATKADVRFGLDQHFDSNALREAINSIPYTRGQAYASLGFKAVRRDIFTEANGMRPRSAGVPRVLVVVTDGNISPAFNPLAEASKLHDDNVNVFVVAVGADTDDSQIQAIASQPAEHFTFQIRSFSLIGDIVDAMSFTACETPAIITAGTTVRSAIKPCETLFFMPQCNHVTNLRIQLQSQGGEAIFFVSRTEEHPSPFHHDYAVATTSPLKTLDIDIPINDTRPIYLSVQAHHVTPGPDGTLPNINFVLDVFSDIFAGFDPTSVDVREDRPVGFEVFTPPNVGESFQDTAFEFSFKTGYDKQQFAINQKTGTVTLTKSLDRSVADRHQLRIMARAVSIPCIAGILDISVVVKDANLHPPVFSQEVYHVEINEGLRSGTPLIQVKATDEDEGDNARIVYTLLSQNLSFAINGETGVIVTTTTLFTSTQQTFILVVAASDGKFTAKAAVEVVIHPVACKLGQYSSTGTLPCFMCPSDTFQDGREERPTSCIACGCSVGSYATGSCTSTRNYDCRACPKFSSSEPRSTQLSDCKCNPGFYRVDNTDGGFSCSRCTQQCPFGTYQSAVCSAKKDTVCTPCRTECPTNHFLSGICGNSTDFGCTPCAECEPGHYVASPCRIDNNRVCKPCRTRDQCGEDEYIQGICKTGMETENPSCLPCRSSCPNGHYLSGTCGGDSGLETTHCVSCAQCSENEYQVQACSLTTNRVCKLCISSCEPGYHLAGTCSDFSSPHCEPCKTADDCLANEYLKGSICNGTVSPSCVKCHPSCASCSGPSANECTSCPSDAHISGRACVDECPRGEFSLGGECHSCSPSCYTCSETRTSCTSCDGSLSLVLLNSTCTSTCPFGHFKDFESGTCRACRLCADGSYKVGGCEGATDTKCMVCLVVM